MGSAGHFSIDEIRQIELDILSAFASFCDEHGFTYRISDGTLLGAVRHHGFIPWDDDIDVVMPCDDYCSMLQLVANGGSIQHPYAFVAFEIDREYYRPWARVYDTRTELMDGRGARLEQRCDKDVYPFIDVFPLIGFSSNKLMRGFQTKRLVAKLKLLELVVGPKKIEGRPVPRAVKTVMRPFARALGQNRIMGSIAGEYARPSRAPRSCALCSEVYSPFGCYWPSRLFEKDRILEFEGRRFSAPDDYHQVLTLTYGDYLQLPPAEERVLDYETKAAWRVDQAGGGHDAK